MIDQAIESFFAELGETREQWLPTAAKLAAGMAFSTHPSKFSHPSTGIGNKNIKNDTYVTPINFQKTGDKEGFLKTGSVNVMEKTDALGNAAALKVYKFLALIMQDGKTLFEHIQQDSPLAKELLTIKSSPYNQLQEGFMAMSHSDEMPVTSSKIKQVYFPVDEGYHLLSTLTNSGVVFELKRRLNKERFSEETKRLRELRKKNEFSDEGYREIYHLTTIGYGGTKPQNISVLNNSNGGKAYLLLSAPPFLEKRNVRFPTEDFFKNSIRYYEGVDAFRKLNAIFNTGRGTISLNNLRTGISNALDNLLELVICRLWEVRIAKVNQYREESSRLPTYQKIWLCGSSKQREEDDHWLKPLYSAITDWILQGYSHKKINKNPLPLGVAEKKFIGQYIETHQEALR